MGCNDAHTVADPAAAQLVECMRAFAHGTAACVIPCEGGRLIDLARKQRLYAVLYGTLPHDYPRTEQTKRAVRFEVASQLMRDDAFRNACGALETAGVDFLTLKGVISRSLYKNGEYRTSGDEDIFVAETDLERCADVLRSLGFNDGERQTGTAAFFDPRASLRIEVHTALFERDRRYADLLNSLFDTSKTCVLDCHGRQIKTLVHTEYLAYTVLHAYVHFTAGGVGIRTACDIVKFAEKYSDRIDENALRSTLEASGALGFAQAVFAFGRLYLDVDTGFFCSECDPYPLLCDMLEGGVYGTSDADRNYSVLLSRGTVNGADGSVRMFFPPLSQMRLKYAYLDRAPFLLPWAWMTRAFAYLFRVTSGERDIAKSVATARKRARLFELYGAGITDGGTSAQRRVEASGEVTIDRTQLSSLLEMTVKRGVQLTLTVTGGSMRPFLRQVRDCVTLAKPDTPPVRGDVALYVRGDGRYVLHRVVRTHAGVYDFAGDAQTRVEKNVGADAVVAVAVSAVRDGRTVSKGCREWDFFARTWLRLLPFRRVVMTLYRPVGWLKLKSGRKKSDNL